MALKANTDTAMRLEAVRDARSKGETSLDRTLLSLKDVLTNAEYSNCGNTRLESYIILRPFAADGYNEKFVIVKRHDFIWK